MSASSPASSSVQPSPPSSESPGEEATLRAGIASGFEVRVQHQPIDVQAEIAPIMRNPNVGAVVNFIGVVRNSGDFDDVVALELEHYSGMTEQSLWGIVEEAIARWKVDAVKIVHRIGLVLLGHAVVLVVVAAPHRAAAFEACEFVMDFLKTHAPFWKKEIRGDGTSEWVKAKRRDEQATLRWG
ncbi:molybdenum cofactor biosynthesis protein MoaE [Paraburkholderia sp. BR10936]|uniref:molybdenum cofactor biosynthesis protein MoaE n=1 Tax=Paraburkholderia sp. BR10936 TaxID=3236993 RepID=UPI0034D24EF9